MSKCREAKCFHLKGIENAMNKSAVFVALLFWNNWCRHCIKIKTTDDYDEIVKNLIDTAELTVL